MRKHRPIIIDAIYRMNGPGGWAGTLIRPLRAKRDSSDFKCVIVGIVDGKSIQDIHRFGYDVGKEVLVFGGYFHDGLIAAPNHGIEDDA